ncbi:exo-beta-N-acetylmuramidase NamZ domain-containing protein [Brevibacillus reuszeri]|uniref:exo-beta-N-acetylmuramidase NamZ domain-containing protein n=1 Tax=Brevibacillus reuszeri TaxID=54915 RepID=UPI002897B4A3|nr:exo-beta-N-acetylmuramidase NamZ domain-containing protein [Brevibacillus reuszeri]
MKKLIPFLILAIILSMIPQGGSSANTAAIQLGSDILFDQFHQQIEGKKVGLVTNQTGVNGQGMSTIDMLRRDRTVKLAALFAPEYGLDGKTSAENQVTSYVHPVYGIPVYGLYGATRTPTKEMLASVDVLLIDLQDVGSRTYTYISTLQYTMTAAKQENKKIIVLDRPNPVGGAIVDGPVLEAPYRSFIGIDTIPLAHGMTIGELALFFNRSIGVDLTVIPMEGYTRSMIFQDTGLTWVQSSPHIPDLASVFGYMATGLGEGTGIKQADNFTWIGGEGIDSVKYADLLNGSLLPGVVFLPENKDGLGGVRLQIHEPRLFNPVKTGMYALAYARQLNHFAVPKSTDKEIVLFDKVMGSNKIGQLLEQGRTPQEIEASYAEQLKQFKELRKAYLIYGEEPYHPLTVIHSKPVVPQVPVVQKPTTPPAGTPGTATPPVTKPPVPNTSGTNGTAVQPPVKPPVPPVQKPVPPANQADKVAYLTFDDGPSPITPLVLDTLKKNNVKATFFIVGSHVPGNEAILKRAISEGHSIGGHTYSHDYRVLYQSKDAFFNDLEKGNQLIEKATGMKPTIFRYPGGSTNTVSLKYQDPKLYNKQQTVMSAIKAESNNRGYIFIDWNVTNGDARSSHYTAAGALANVKQQVKSQKEIVILMHDASTKAATAQALPEVISFLKEKGYRFDVITAEHPTISTVK